jgi:hypothetical protein
MGFDAGFSRAAGGARLGRRDAARAPTAAAERDAFARFVLVEELLAAGAPVARTGSPTARAAR